MIESKYFDQKTYLRKMSGELQLLYFHPIVACYIQSG